MKIKWGALVVDGRNKIGGQVASKNRAGAYMRNKVTPVNPSSSSQVTVRSRLSSISSSWRSLSDNQRTAWNNAVSDYKKTDIFGDIQNPSGFNLYQRLNNVLLNIGAAMITTPLSPLSVGVFTTVGVSVDSDTGVVTATVTPATLPVGVRVIVRATAGQSLGKSFIKSEYRQIAVISSITGGTITLTSAFLAKFGSPAANMKYFFQFVHADSTTGQVSLAQEAVASTEE